MSERMKLNLTTLLSIVVLVAAVCASFYGSQAASKAYADERVRELRMESEERDRCMQKEFGEMKVDLGVVKQILVERYGQPHIAAQ